MSNALEAISKLKLKNSKNHFYFLSSCEGSHFNELLQSSHKDTSLNFSEVTKTIFFTKQCPHVRDLLVTAQLVLQVVSNVVSCACIAVSWQV